MGLTLSVDDPFWDKHHPGDLWNCKCYLEPTTAEPTPKKRIPKEKYAPKPSKGLESNPGKKAEMYSRNHPYYLSNATDLHLAKTRQRRCGSYAWQVLQCGGCKVPRGL